MCGIGEFVSWVALPSLLEDRMTVGRVGRGGTSHSVRLPSRTLPKTDAECTRHGRLISAIVLRNVSSHVSSGQRSCQGLYGLANKLTTAGSSTLPSIRLDRAGVTVRNADVAQHNAYCQKSTLSLMVFSI